MPHLKPVLLTPANLPAEVLLAYFFLQLPGGPSCSLWFYSIWMCRLQSLYRGASVFLHLALLTYGNMTKQVKLSMRGRTKIHWPYSSIPPKSALRHISIWGPLNSISCPSLDGHPRMTAHICFHKRRFWGCPTVCCTESHLCCWLKLILSPSVKLFKVWPVRSGGMNYFAKKGLCLIDEADICTMWWWWVFFDGIGGFYVTENKYFNELSPRTLDLEVILKTEYSALLFRDK